MMITLPITRARRTLLDATCVLVCALLVLLLSLFFSDKKPNIYDFNVYLMIVIAIERIITARWTLAHA
jgi:hypothetical protein